MADRASVEAIPVALMHAVAEPIAVGTVVLIISYFSLIFGELVPKILAINNPERLALFAARPLEWFARVAAWGICRGRNLWRRSRTSSSNCKASGTSSFAETPNAEG